MLLNMDNYMSTRTNIGQLITMVKRVEEAISIIESITEKSERVQMCVHQCQRLADRLKHLGPSIKQLWKEPNSTPVGSSDSSNFIAFAGLVTVLRKSEILVTECMSDNWASTVLVRPVRQQDFEEIHKELSLCTRSLLLAEGSPKPDLLASDAQLDETELLKNLSTTFHSAADSRVSSLTSTVAEWFDINHMDCETFTEDNPNDATHLPSFVQIAPSAFRDERYLGSGDYGEVTKADWFLSSVVIKDFPWCGGYTDAWYDEAVPMIRYQHPHVIQLMGFVPDTKKAVMEYMLGSDLRNFIGMRLEERSDSESLQDGPFSLSEAMDIMRQVASALSYVHQKGYMHGDRVLTLNVMVKESQNHSLDVKIGDLGVPQKRRVEWRLDLDKPCPENLRKELIRWTAPEVYSGKELRHYSAMSDVYSFGIMCSEVLTGKFPFGDVTDMEEVRGRVLAGERPLLPDTGKPDLEQLIRDCWQEDCTLRPDANEVCERLERIMFPVPVASLVITEGVCNSQPKVLEKQLSSLPYYLRIPESDLRMIRELGRGGFACVYEAKWQGSKCAVKRLFGEANIGELQREVQMLRKLRHPQIVQLMGFSAAPCSIVMELMTEDLPALYKRRLNTAGHQGPPFGYATTLSIIKQIASGMARLHNSNILHRDLKGGNVLVHAHGHDVEAKIADFGVSQYTHGQSARDYSGTGFWRSPELLRAKEMRMPFEYTTKGDVYSFAMTCYEVLTGKLPFQDYLYQDDDQSELTEGTQTRYSHKEITEMLVDPAGNWSIPRRPQLPEVDGVNFALLHLIEDCWNDVPDVRHSFEEITNRLEKMPRQ